MTNILKREQQQSTDPYSLLTEGNERKNLTNRKILGKYVSIETSCLTQKEKEKLMDMLCRNKEAFSLRDEIGTSPNIEIEIDAVDKTPFFIRPYCVKG